MADEYYSLDEALKKLALRKEDLETLVKEGRLREFRIDGQQKYKVEEIDALAAEINPSIGTSDASSSDIGSESAIELLPADSTDGGTDIISLEDSSEQIAPVKSSGEDTVITPAGVSVFDEDELAGMDADPMAKTQIAPSVTDELSLEGGGGSGLLDMSRESDDTSLGAELLDEIYSGKEEGGVAVAEEEGQEQEAFEGFEQVQQPAAGVAPVMLQVVDPLAGLFTGLLVSAAILLGLVGLAAASLTAGVLPGFIAWLASNMLITLIGSIVIIGAGAGLGYILGSRQ